MTRTEFTPSWEGPGDGTIYNSPGLFEYSTTLDIYSFETRDYIERKSNDPEDPNGPPLGTGVVAGEAKKKWWEPEVEETVDMSDEDFWLKVDNGDYNFS